MKAKTRTKKLLSLLLAAIMLFGMIPATTLGIFAEGTDGNLTINANDEAGTVYTIYGPEDWATVAAASAAGNKFADMVVELGASIGGTESAPLTLAPLFTDFAGTFDGNSDQGFTISNVAVSGKALLAVTLSGEVSVSDLTTDNITISGTDDLNQAGGLVGVSNATDLSVTNTVVDVTITTTATLGGDNSAVGAMIGLVEAPATEITIDGCTVTGSVTAPTAYIGGIAGHVKVPNDDTYSLTVKNTEIDADLAHSAGAAISCNYRSGIGGVFALVTPDYVATANFEGDITDAKGSVLIDNVKVSGTINPTKDSSGAAVVAHVWGASRSTTGGFSTDFTVTRCELTADLIKNGTLDAGVAMVYGDIGYSGWGGAANKQKHQLTGTFTVTDTLVGGTIDRKDAVAATYVGFAGLIGYIGSYGTTINVYNVAITTEWVDESGAMPNLYVGRWWTSNAKLNIYDCVTNFEGTAGEDYILIGNLTHQGSAESYPIIVGRSFNGVEILISEMNANNQYWDDSLSQQGDTQINAMIKRDANGDILYINFAEGPDGNLVIDPEATTYVICGPQDWATVAAASAAGNTFTGKTVELGTSLIGTEEEPLTLVPLFTGFAGTFDGNGRKISNVAVNGKALLAEKLSDTVVSIKDLTTDNIIISRSDELNNVGGLIGCAEATAEGSLALSITNVVVDVAITSTVTEGTAMSAVGGMIGLLATGATTSATATQITIDGCTVTGSIQGCASNIGGVAGLVKIPDNDTYCFTVKNTDVDIDLTGVGTVASSHLAGMGSVVGGLVPNMTSGSYSAAEVVKCTQGTILFENLKVEGTLAPVYPVGGIIGTMYGGHGNAERGFATDVIISKCDIAPTITGGSGINRGGVVGHFGGYGWTNANQQYYTGLFDVVECVIGVKVTQMGGTLGSGTFTTGGVIGLGAFHGATVNVQNCAIVPVFDEGVVSTHDGTYPAASLIVGRLRPQYVPTAPTDIRVQNCVTNVTGTPDEDFWLVGNSNNLKLNGNALAINTDGSDDSLCQMTDAQINAMIKRDANGDILSIGGVLTGGYLQYTAAYTVTPEEGDPYTAYAIRFIALSQLDAPANAGIKVVVKDADGNVVAEADTLECKAYMSLTAYAPSGAALETYNAKDYGASRFIAVVIEDIPTGADYSFEVTPHYVVTGGITIYGKTTVAQFDATGNLVNGVN